MARLIRPEVTTNYEIWGTRGPWVTLVNGHNRPLNDFRMLGRHLAEQGRRVLALDNRGSGETESHGDFTVADMAGDVTALWDYKGVTSSDVLGISMGGFIVQELVRQSAAVIRRLIFVSTAQAAKALRADDKPWSASFEEVEAKLKPYFTAQFAERNAVLVRSMAKQIAQSVSSGDFIANSERQRRAIGSFNGGSALTAVRVPTLVIHGMEDQIIPVAAARDLAAKIPDGKAKLELLDGAGHLLLAERPKELYALVAGFFPTLQ